MLYFNCLLNLEGFLLLLLLLWAWVFFFFETGSCYIVKTSLQVSNQAGLEPPYLCLLRAGITDVYNIWLVTITQKES